jgi:hypothetical protein
LLVLFLYKKRSIFPRAYIMIFGAILLFHFCDNLLATYFVKVENLALAKEWTSLIITSIAYALWTVYFLRSERVKATFTNRYRPVHSKTDILSIHTTTLEAVAAPQEIEVPKKVGHLDGS